METDAEWVEVNKWLDIEPTKEEMETMKKIVIAHLKEKEIKSARSGQVRDIMADIIRKLAKDGGQWAKVENRYPPLILKKAKKLYDLIYYRVEIIKTKCKIVDHGIKAVIFKHEPKEYERPYKAMREEYEAAAKRKKLDDEQKPLDILPDEGVPIKTERIKSLKEEKSVPSDEEDLWYPEWHEALMPECIRKACEYDKAT